MADADYDEFDAYDGAREPARAATGVQKWVNAAGALTSVALVVGLAVWTYNLAMRDVRGVPVIRALEGPARVAPDNPGGESALHQGMAVNEIAEDGTAGDPADTLTLAPRPESLADEDQPMGTYASDDSAVNPQVSAASAPVVDPDFSTGTAGVRPAEPLPDGPADPINPAPEGVAEEAEPFVAPDVIAASVPGLSASLRPNARPDRLMSVPASPAGDDETFDAMAEAAAAAVAAALAPPVTEIAPEELPDGTRLVQIGAYPNEAEARLGWESAEARFGSLMEGKRRVIEPAEAGGEPFYRLRVEGFTDLEDARAFCAALKAEGAECVPAQIQ